MQQVAVHHGDLAKAGTVHRIVAALGSTVRAQVPFSIALQGLHRPRHLAHRGHERQLVDRVQGQRVGAADGHRVEPAAHAEQLELAGRQELLDVRRVHGQVQRIHGDALPGAAFQRAGGKEGLRLAQAVRGVRLVGELHPVGSGRGLGRGIGREGQYEQQQEEQVAHGPTARRR